MLLKNVLGLLVAERPVSKITAQQYARSVGSLSDFLGQAADVSHLSLECVNGWLMWLEREKQLSATSVRNYRTGLLVVWNYAVHPLGLTQEFSARRVRRPRCPVAPVQAWGMESVRLLIEAAGGIQGRMKCGLPNSLAGEVWVRLGVETGLRPSDLRLITWRQLDFASQRLILNQHKTGGAVVVGFSGVTKEKLLELNHYGFQRILPMTKTVMRRLENKIFAAAEKLGFCRQSRQGLGMLRKTHGTEVYRSHGLAAAAESLGHRSGDRVTRDHYVDSGVRQVYLVTS